MEYSEARRLIKDGDLIAVRGEAGVLAFLTRLVTRSRVTHTGTALWMDGGLWMAEINSGRNHAVPLSQLDKTDFDVYHCPVEDRVVVRQAIEAALRSKIDYGFSALLVIGLLNWLQIKVFLHARRILVCSGYCVMIYETAGWPERTRILSPRELIEQLEFKFSVVAGDTAGAAAFQS